MPTYRIEQDEDPINPLTEWDNLGHIVCWHRRYNLGDVKTDLSPEEWLSENGSAIILPVYMYDHSGIALSTGREYPFNDPWDSGQVGFVYATRADVLKEYGRKRMSRQLVKLVEKVLRGELATYSAYLSGEVYGYVVEDDEGNELDSCWGYYGYEDAVAAGEEALAAWEETA